MRLAQPGKICRKSRKVSNQRDTSSNLPRVYTEGQKIVAENADKLVTTHANNNQVKKLIGNMGAVAKVRI